MVINDLGIVHHQLELSLRVLRRSSPKLERLVIGIGYLVVGRGTHNSKTLLRESKIFTQAKRVLACLILASDAVLLVHHENPLQVLRLGVPLQDFKQFLEQPRCCSIATLARFETHFIRHLLQQLDDSLLSAFSCLHLVIIKRSRQSAIEVVPWFDEPLSTQVCT